MKRKGLALLSIAIVMAILSAASEAQPPGRKGGFGPGGRKGKFGPPSGLIRAVDDLQLSESQRETVVAAVRHYEDDGHLLAGMAGANLLLKMKEIVSPEQFTKLREAADRSRGGPERLNVDSIVEHIMSFDKNKDGKISKDELPERMQDMFAKGDTNKDGFLDAAEIKKLAVELAKEEPADRDPFGGRGAGGRGPRGRPNGEPGPSPAAVERAIGNLKLTGKTKEAADDAIKTNQSELRKMTEFARADLLLTITDVLNADQCKRIKAALERQPAFDDGPPGRRGPPFGGPFGRGGFPKE